MSAGKPKDQSLAIAYSVKRKASKKKMAQGGQVPPSAKTESRPSPDQRGEETARNSGNKPAHMDSVTSRPDIMQSQRGPKTQRIKHPTMAQSPVFKVKLRDQEDDLQDSSSVNNGPQEQPPHDDNEMGPDRHGPKVPDMQREHSNGHKAYAKGGMINEEVPMEEAEELGNNGEPKDPEDSDMDELRPSQEDYMSGHEEMLADGGEVGMDHQDSIAAAIMARRDRLHDEIDSGAHDLDEAVKMAEGGEINGMDSIDTHEEADQADLRRNAEEDANMEDQTSFNALRKENYSESEGLDELDNPSDSGQRSHRIDKDDHDMVDKIRRGMSAKRQFKAR